MRLKTEHYCSLPWLVTYFQSVTFMFLSRLRFKHSSNFYDWTLSLSNISSSDKELVKEQCYEITSERLTFHFLVLVGSLHTLTYGFMFPTQLASQNGHVHCFKKIRVDINIS